MSITARLTSVLIYVLFVTFCESLAVFDAEAQVRRVTSQDILDEVRTGQTTLTVVNMWATWCGPCVEEFPEIIQTASRFDTTKVRLIFVSVDFEEQIPEMLNFLEDQGWKGTPYFKNEKDDAFVTHLSPDWTGAVPATLVFSESGALLWFREGSLSEGELGQALNTLLKSGADGGF